MPDKLPHCLIRVDGSEKIGTGHIMRCLALASALTKAGSKVSFLLAQCPQPLKNRLREEGFGTSTLPKEIEPGSDVDARFTARMGDELGASWVVVDGYHFLTPYQRLLKQARLHVLYIDDLAHCDYYCADLVLNQNPSANQLLYSSCEPQTELLLGLDYVLMRSEFLTYKNTNQRREVTQEAKSILLTMGGSDIDNVTALVMAALRFTSEARALQVTVVIGAGNKHVSQLQELALSLNDGAHHFQTEVNASNMPELLGASDLVVSAGGTTVWEAAYLGRPTAVIITADNQRAGMERFAAQGAVALLGCGEDLTPVALAEQLTGLITNVTRRKTLANRAATLIDGRGAGLVVQRLGQPTAE